MSTRSNQSPRHSSARTVEKDIRPLLHEVTGSGDPIVLMPGILTGWASWQAHADRLAKRHTVVRAQLRGVELVEAGKAIPDNYSVAMERDALLAMVDTLELDRFDLAGWSLGGLVSLAFTLEHPERIRTLTLIEPAAGWILRETGNVGDTQREEQAFDRSFANRNITTDDLVAFLVRAGLGGPDTDFTAHPRWPLMVRNRQVLSTLGAIDAHTDSLNRLRAVNVPILVVRGTDSIETDRTIAAEIVAHARNATLLELPGDHACFLEHPDQFLAALEAHIAKESSS